MYMPGRDRKKVTEEGTDDFDHSKAGAESCVDHGAL